MGLHLSFDWMSVGADAVEIGVIFSVLLVVTIIIRRIVGGHWTQMIGIL